MVECYGRAIWSREAVTIMDRLNCVSVQCWLLIELCLLRLHILKSLKEIWHMREDPNMISYMIYTLVEFETSIVALL